jgi:hypothetical protein
MVLRTRRFSVERFANQTGDIPHMLLPVPVKNDVKVAIATAGRAE